GSWATGVIGAPEPSGFGLRLICGGVSAGRCKEPLRLLALACELARARLCSWRTPFSPRIPVPPLGPSSVRPPAIALAAPASSPAPSGPARVSPLAAPLVDPRWVVPPDLLASDGVGFDPCCGLSGLPGDVPPPA